MLRKEANEVIVLSVVLNTSAAHYVLAIHNVPVLNIQFPNSPETNKFLKLNVFSVVHNISAINLTSEGTLHCI